MASLSSRRSRWPLGTFGTNLWLLALSPAIPLAIIGNCFNSGPSWLFFSSLLGVALLSERVIFLTQLVAYSTGPAVGGLVNATFGNVPELVVSIFALCNHKTDVLKCYLLGSIVSNLLLLGASLYYGGIVKLRNLKKYDKRQAIVNSYMLLLALLCHLLPIPFRINVGASDAHPENLSLSLPIASSITMLIVYFRNLVFQLRKKYNQSSEALYETRMMGLWRGIVWSVVMITLTVLLSKYVVDTIEVPLCVTIAWVMGIKMDLNFNLPETGFLTLAIVAAAFPLQGWLPSFRPKRESNGCLVKMEKKNWFLLVSIVMMVFFSCGDARLLHSLDQDMPNPGPNPCTTVPGRNQGHCINGMNIGGRTISPPTPPPVSS